MFGFFASICLALLHPIDLHIRLIPDNWIHRLVKVYIGWTICSRRWCILIFLIFNSQIYILQAEKLQKELWMVNLLLVCFLIILPVQQSSLTSILSKTQLLAMCVAKWANIYLKLERIKNIVHNIVTWPGTNSRAKRLHLKSPSTQTITDLVHWASRLPCGQTILRHCKKS